MITYPKCFFKKTQIPAVNKEMTPSNLPIKIIYYGPKHTDVTVKGRISTGMNEVLKSRCRQARMLDSKYVLPTL